MENNSQKPLKNVYDGGQGKLIEALLRYLKERELRDQFAPLKQNIKNIKNTVKSLIEEKEYLANLLTEKEGYYLINTKAINNDYSLTLRKIQKYMPGQSVDNLNEIQGLESLISNVNEQIQDKKLAYKFSTAITNKIKLLGIKAAEYNINGYTKQLNSQITKCNKNLTEFKIELLKIDTNNNTEESTNLGIKKLEEDVMELLKNFSHGIISPSGVCNGYSLLWSFNQR
jgi:hypothetical protein